MKTRTTLLVIVVVLAIVVLLLLFTQRAKSQESVQRLSREEITKIMQECWADAYKIDNVSYTRDISAQTTSRLAIAMFYGRIGMIPVIDR